MPFDTQAPDGALALGLALLVAHLLGDYPLQPRRWVGAKRARAFRAPELYLHGAVNGALAWLLAQQWAAWWIGAAVGLGHVLFDGAKARAGRDGTGAFLADQLAHLLVIVALAVGVARAGADPVRPGVAWWGLAASFLLVWWFEGVLIGRVTARWRADLGGSDLDARGLADAGLWIGRLERTLILVFVLLGRFEAVGFLIAAKSVFRFGEVTQPGQRREAEYILIGTMASFLLALLTGLGARALL